jgi:hypothetical protein
MAGGRVVVRLSVGNSKRKGRGIVIKEFVTFEGMEGT